MAQTELQQEIVRIRQLMEAGQQAADAGGRHFIAWGVLVALGAVATHVVIGQRLAVPVWAIWVTVLAAGWALALWLARRGRARAAVRTVADRLLAWLWLGCAAAMSAAAAAAAGDLLPAQAVAGVVALVLGAGYCASAPLVGRWLIILAVAWWVGGLVLLMMPQLPTLLVFAGLLLLLQVVPGIVLVVRPAGRARG